MADIVDFPDINVWLALGAADHPHHERARLYWYEESGERIAFCRVTALGFVRLATHPAVMGGRQPTVAEAWQAYLAFRRLPDVVLTDEPEGCEAVLEGRVVAGRVPPRLWTDGYLAAFARAGGLRLVSFDRDFARFDGLHLLRLEK